MTMKPAIFLLCSNLLIVACSNKDGKTASKDSSDPIADTLIVKHENKKPHVQQKEFDASLLQGVWWLKKDDVSALFKIEGDYLYYTEDLNSPYLIKAKGDTLWMIRDKNKSAFKLKILTKDSLVFFDENINEDVSLIKKR